MRRALPFSLIFFAASGGVSALQLVPVISIVGMFALAMFWSVLLLNAGFIGIAIEAATGRVSRYWLVVPLVFYGGYWAIAVHERLALHALSTSYAAANARVATGFDPERQALVFEGGEGSGWLTRNYALQITYSVNTNFPEGHLSHRMLDSTVCAKVSENPAAAAAFVNTSGFHDGRESADLKFEERFCNLSMPERPALPVVRVSRKEQKFHETTLPVTRFTTTITMPDGRSFQVLGGTAAPLKWIPMPVMGCGLNSGMAKIECFAKFWRDGFTPIVSGQALAQALGLKPVAIAERRGADPELVLARIAAVEDATLARQLANIDAMIRDPIAKGVVDWQVRVVVNRPEALNSRADAIMTGVERAAAVTGKDHEKTRDTGRILAGLLAELPRERFIGFGPRILAVYATANDGHWLWEAGRLLRRLGDLGTGALPSLLSPRALRLPNEAAIEGLCRVGEPGQEASESALRELWSKAWADSDRSKRAALFVTLHRIGVTLPPIPDGKLGELASLQSEWGDVSPRSPLRVCAIRAEERARYEEKIKGKRRTNID